MKIASSAVQLESSHLKTQHPELRESLRAWTGSKRPDFEGNQRARAAISVAAPTVQISDEGKIAQSSEASAIQEGIDAAENDPMLRLIRAMIAMLTGHEAEVFDANEMQVETPATNVQIPTASTETDAAQQAAGYGVEYDRHEIYSETEQTTFEASGVVKTEDGREISFDLALSMSRSYYEESNLSLRLGDARQVKDPLVLNFSGTAAQLTSQRFKFDLDADGTSDEINFVAGGSGFLAFDRSGDGRINNGTELFGATTGDGFAELAALDSDSNGWIDENDSAYEQLLVWTKDASGNDLLSTLKDANVGALNLARVATPFDLKDSSNTLQGQIRSSGIFLQEDGRVGTLQQIDLTV